MDYRCIERQDEWNPHIVRGINDISAKTIKKLEVFGAWEIIAPKIMEFREKYDEMSGIINALPDRVKAPFTDWFPLAYRFDPILSTPQEQDDLDKQKFGGIPNLMMAFQFIYPYEKAKQEPPKLDMLIKSLWPTCGCCGQAMRFIGQVDLSEWLVTIAYLTGKMPTPVESYHTDSNLRSGVGYKHAFEHFPSNSKWYLMFACDCYSWEMPSHNAAVIMMSKSSREPEETPLWTKEEYISAVEKFTLENHIHPILSHRDLSGKIDLQFIRQWELGFDFDSWEDTPLRGTIAEDKVFEKFSNWRSKYKMFGEPRSQQTEMRYACYNTHPMMHRQAPIICYSDSEHDVTRQMYGCLCCGGEERKIWAKMDDSCT